jgi:hypothetical protein
MRTFTVNFLLVILYALIGALIEVAGYTSPALFAFYGFCIGALAMAVNIHLANNT